MKNMDKFWRDYNTTINTKKGKKMVWGGYIIGFTLIIIAIFMLCQSLSTQEEFSFESISSPLFTFAVGLALVCYVFFRKKLSKRIKFYLISIVFTGVGIDMVIRPTVEYHRVIGIIECIVFGGGGLWVLYNDCKWYLGRKK